MTTLSILDLAPIPQGANAGEALRRSLDLAQHAEGWGYRRFWLAEHHNMPGIASAATAVAIGFVAGGTSTIRARADELTGVGLAKFGIATSIFCFVAGASWLTYEYATEVPPNTLRVAYEDLQPDPDRPSQLIPPSVAELDGKRIFIKGYVYPSKKMDNIRQFILCRDKGDCCFGGNPKLTDRIQVTLMRGLRMEYSTKLFKLAGVFHVSPSQASGMDGGVLYHLEADLLK